MENQQKDLGVGCEQQPSESSVRASRSGVSAVDAREWAAQVLGFPNSDALAAHERWMAVHRAEYLTELAMRFGVRA